MILPISPGFAAGAPACGFAATGPPHSLFCRLRRRSWSGLPTSSLRHSVPGPPFAFRRRRPAHQLGIFDIRRRRPVACILHQDRNPPVRWIVRIALHPQKLVRVAAHLRYLVAAHAVLLQQPPRRVGAIRRKLPVAVIRVGGVLRRIRVPLDQQRIRNRLQLRRQQRQQLLPARLKCGLPLS